MRKKIIQTILVIIYGNGLMFEQIFLSPQVKQIVSISNTHGIYKLPHKSTNDLRFSILGSYEILRKSQISIEV